MIQRGARAPGRVNLIGDHTDYTSGLVLPMAIDRDTVVEGVATSDRVVRLTSAAVDGEAIVALDVDDPRLVEPSWARYVAGVVHELRPVHGFTGTVRSTVPVGAGLSSSAALEVSVALALGASGDRRDLARLCQRAEQVASGVPCGIMDQLTAVTGVEGHALLIDCHTLSIEPVAIPDTCEIVVVHSGVPRGLAGSAYAERVRECTLAEESIGPLRVARPAAVYDIADETIRARARHVVSENERVRAFAAALRSGDLTTAGRLMVDSHASLRDDYEVSTPELDALVDRLCRTRGVYGARLTGAGFGGCVVALTAPGTRLGGSVVRAVAGATSWESRR